MCPDAAPREVPCEAEYIGGRYHSGYSGESTRCDDQGPTPHSPADGNARTPLVRLRGWGLTMSPEQTDRDEQVEYLVERFAIPHHEADRLLENMTRGDGS